MLSLILYGFPLGTAASFEFVLKTKPTSKMTYFVSGGGAKLYLLTENKPRPPVSYT